MSDILSKDGQRSFRPIKSGWKDLIADVDGIGRTKNLEEEAFNNLNSEIEKFYKKYLEKAMGTKIDPNVDKYLKLINDNYIASQKGIKNGINNKIREEIESITIENFSETDGAKDYVIESENITLYMPNNYSRENAQKLANALMSACKKISDGYFGAPGRDNEHDNQSDIFVPVGQEAGDAFLSVDNKKGLFFTEIEFTKVRLKDVKPDGKLVKKLKEELAPGRVVSPVSQYLENSSPRTSPIINGH